MADLEDPLRAVKRHQRADDVSRCLGSHRLGDGSGPGLN